MYIQLDSQVLYYEKTGEGAPLLMLHGNSEDHSIFDVLAKSLEPHFLMYLPDMRGCGLSSPAREYHYGDMADDMIKLIRALDIKKPSILGFSDGGIVALLCAIKEPELLDRLIVCGANTSPDGVSFWTRQKIKAEYRKSRSDMVKMMLREPDISEQQLAQIRSRTLVCAGEKDMIKQKETRRIAGAIPDSALSIILGHDHGSYIIHSDRMAVEVLNFLKD